jgi:hypothetical protein
LGSENEVEEILSRPLEDRPGTDGFRIVIGKTFAGRYLRVVYIPDPEPNTVFVVTAYDLRGKPLVAFRRRNRRTSR